MLPSQDGAQSPPGRHPTPRYRHVIVACARWEEDDIVEWLEYHRSISFDHAYVYSNDDDPFVLHNRLLPYLLGDDPFVTFRHWPTVGDQAEIYLHFLRHNAQETEWATFIDIDEFIVLKGVDDIATFMGGFVDNFDCVQFNWLNYGCGGRQWRDKRGVLLNMTRRAAGVDVHTKNIFRTAAVTADLAREGDERTGYSFHHGWDSYRIPGFRVCDVLGQPINDYSTGFPDNAVRAIAMPGHSEALIARAYVAHFQFKAEEDFLRRVRRGGFAAQATWRAIYEDGSYQSIISSHSQTEDAYLYDYWARRVAPTLAFTSEAGDDVRQLAHFKPTFQSSFHAFGPLEELPSSSAGNDGVKTGGFGFHTDFEDQPWWMVDLLDDYDLHEVRLFNRLTADYASRAETVRIDASLDRVAWTPVFEPPPPVLFGGVDGEPLVVTLPRPLPTRYVRVSLRTANYLHLDEVEVLGTPRRVADAPSDDNAAPLVQIPNDKAVSEPGSRASEMTAPTRPTTTLCGIFRDEVYYIVEWVAYHRLLGFDRIVIYSNECTDGTDDILDGLARLRVIEHRPWPNRPGQSPQVSAYNDAVMRCDTHWIMFIDADEFVHLAADRTVAEFQARFPPDVSAIAINWRVFGSSGHAARGPEPVIERFAKASLRASPVNRHCKTMAIAADIDQPNVHRCFLKRGRYVDTHGNDIQIQRMGFTPVVRHEIAQINHYVVKSREEFEVKRRRGSANRPPESPTKYGGRDDNYFTAHDLNQQTDIAIQARLEAVRAEMAALEFRLQEINARQPG